MVKNIILEIFVLRNMKSSKKMNYPPSNETNSLVASRHNISTKEDSSLYFLSQKSAQSGDLSYFKQLILANDDGGVYMGRQN